jgi:acid stress-induced BolA-like protein IbaG/YrbA
MGLVSFEGWPFPTSLHAPRKNPPLPRAQSILFKNEARPDQLAKALQQLLDHALVIHRAQQKGDAPHKNLIRECSLLVHMHSILRRYFAASALASYYDHRRLHTVLEELNTDGQQLKEWISQYITADSLGHEGLYNAAHVMEMMCTRDIGERDQVLQAVLLHHRAKFFIFCLWIA